MPTYQYSCVDCGEQLEAVQKFSDDPLTVCPACNGKLRKVFSAVGVVFKGSGFYRTDSRDGQQRSGGSNAGKDSGSKESSSSGKESSSADSGSGKSSDSSSSSVSSGSGSGKDSGSKAGTSSSSGSSNAA
ncbi:FmdB family zinc ribbon protein [Actinopolymorpha sp. NPDC004070]|uniref:FmdB family zinc ribbon protein n=1 Tax=Actinopolymorpha sp. NPDC004070 TaxID=3154548 RepID=UPI0033B1C2E0